MSAQPGSAVFQEVPPGQLTIEVFYQNMMYGKTTTEMPDNNDHTVTVQLIEGVKFFVFEQYTAGQQNRVPIADVEVEIQGPTTVKLKTDQNGIAGPILLTKGAYTVTYRKTGYVTKSMNMSLLNDYESGVIETGLDRTLRVQVFGRNNQPLQGAVVSAGTISFTTDAQGFAYLNLPSGTHTVNVTPPANSGLESTSFSVTIDLDPRSQVTRQVTLTPAAIRVTVVNPRNNRAPVDNASVTLIRPGQQPVTISTDRQGFASFVYQDHNITTGTYEIEVYKRGFRRTRRGNIQVSNVNQSVNVEIEMPWTLLTVHVRDPRGQPVSGAIVRVYQGNTQIGERPTQ